MAKSIPRLRVPHFRPTRMSSEGLPLIIQVGFTVYLAQKDARREHWKNGQLLWRWLITTPLRLSSLASVSHSNDFFRVEISCQGHRPSLCGFWLSAFLHPDPDRWSLHTHRSAPCPAHPGDAPASQLPCSLFSPYLKGPIPWDLLFKWCSLCLLRCFL